MRKILIITGLTGSGKSNLAIDIAKEYNGEIISADSVQIYKGLDIGSAKESKDIREQIPHHLIDIKEFNSSYNVGDFIADCKSAIDLILSKNKLPIIVGGTGLYVKSLIEGYSLGNVASNLEFRKRYEELAEKEGNLAVWEILNKQNPEKAKTVHYNNLKRVIRYLELEQSPTNSHSKTESILSSFDCLNIGIVADREEIYNKINARVDIMLANGLENEVKDLINSGATREHQSMNSIGYKEWFDYFDGKVSYTQTIDLIKQHTRNYCKRQLTFLKTIPNLEMVTIAQAKEKIKEFLNDRT